MLLSVLPRVVTHSRKVSEKTANVRIVAATDNHKVFGTPPGDDVVVAVLRSGCSNSKDLTTDEVALVGAVTEVTAFQDCLPEHLMFEDSPKSTAFYYVNVKESNGDIRGPFAVDRNILIQFKGSQRLIDEFDLWHFLQTAEDSDNGVSGRWPADVRHDLQDEALLALQNGKRRKSTGADISAKPICPGSQSGSDNDDEDLRFDSGRTETDDSEDDTGRTVKKKGSEPSVKFGGKNKGSAGKVVEDDSLADSMAGPGVRSLMADFKCSEQEAIKFLSNIRPSQGRRNHAPDS